MLPWIRGCHTNYLHAHAQDLAVKKMASQGERSQKWKQKRMLEARAERMRAAKQARLQQMCESSDRDDQQTCGSDSQWRSSFI